MGYREWEEAYQEWRRLEDSVKYCKRGIAEIGEAHDFGEMCGYDPSGDDHARAFYTAENEKAYDRMAEICDDAGRGAKMHGRELYLPEEVSTRLAKKRALKSKELLWYYDGYFAGTDPAEWADYELKFFISYTDNGPLMSRYINLIEFGKAEDRVGTMIELANEACDIFDSWGVFDEDKRLDGRTDPGLCLEAVQQDGMELARIDNPTPEMRLKALKQNGMALQYIPQEEQTLPMAVAALRQAPESLEYLAACFKKPEVFRAAGLEGKDEARACPDTARPQEWSRN